jgi:phosphoglycolate phosphatase/pyrophosphatase PpaX
MCRKWYQFTDEELKQEYEGWMDYVRSHVPDPFPGIGDVIRRQKEAGGLVCVVSHSSAENITRDYMTHFGMLPDAIYGWDLPEHQRKPHTYSLEAIMEKYGLSPRELLVIDDMKPAWEMASKAGVEIGFAAWGKEGFPTIAKEMKALCDYSFQDPKELEHFLFD